MLLAKDVVPIETAFVGVLEHIPGTKASKQEYFQSRGMRIPRTSYEAIWEALVARLHHSGAAFAIFECLQVHMPRRLKELLRQAGRGRPVILRAAEPAIVWDFFFQNGNLRRIGELFLEESRSGGTNLDRTSKVVQARPVASKPLEIALSFAGEDRAYVEEVAQALRSMGVRVFYDAFEKVNLLGKDLAAHFAEVYGKKANYCAMFISQHYVRKAWPQFERQHAQARALAEKREYILPIRLDGSEVPGLSPTIGHLDARGMQPKSVAEILFQKCRGRG
jgi:TIR domain